MFTLKQLCAVVGSGVFCNVGLRSYNGWHIEKMRLIHLVETSEFSQFEGYPVYNIYDLDNGGIAIVLDDMGEE